MGKEKVDELRRLREERATRREKEFHFAGYKFKSGPGGTVVDRRYVDTSRLGDHGADPLGDGRFRMVPSGDVVTAEERDRRLGIPGVDD